MCDCKVIYICVCVLSVCSRSRRADEFGFTLDRQAIAGSASNLDVVDEAVRGIRWRIMHVQPQDDPGGPKLGCILLLPSSKQPGVNGGDLQQQTELGSTPHTDITVPPSSFPLIVMVHGGPHSNSGTHFNKDAAYLCATQRKAILMVNYRLGI